MLSHDEIYAKLSEYLQDLFEVPEEEITPKAKLFEDLDLDSIDAVDLVVKLQELTGKKIPPEEFKTVRTVNDIVQRVHALMSQQERMKPGIKLKPATVFATVVGILYPFAVYFGLQVSTPLVVVLCLLTFLCFRIFLKWRETTRKIELIALSVTFICVAGLLLIDQMLAIKVYPVAISLSLAALFIYSFFFPPTVIERFARMSEPTLNKSGVRYTRKVTIIWIVFFICNAAASLMTALWGNLEIWAFYNGFLSYVFVGGLMAGEFVVRQFVKKYHHGENE